MTPFLLIMLALGAVAGLVALSRSAQTRQGQIIAAKADAPATVHPKFDAYGCIATGACIAACPEKNLPIGMVQGKPRLINPSSCIGHGDCMKVCPVKAIDLVIGTAAKGVEVPALSSEFESSQGGLFIAGELGGMGLIHNAVRQGTVAAEAALRTIRKQPDPTLLDLVIVGAGPAGLGAAAFAQKVGASYRLLEKRRIGGAIASYPRGKVVMTSAMRFAGMPPLMLKRTTKEALIEEIRNVIETLALAITPDCDVSKVQREADGMFQIVSSVGTMRAQRVIIAVGRRGAPRKIGALGDNDPAILYELEDPALFAGKCIMVVGGGDSAIEAAHALCQQPQTKVILVHRSGSFGRAKPDNQTLVETMRAMKHVEIYTDASILEIAPKSDLADVASPAPNQLMIQIKQKTDVTSVPVHNVIACLGAELPTGWLHSMGVEVVTRRGEPLMTSR
jgi:thioredoxin reductase (NADPH)